MNYYDTLIEVADDCPATEAQVPQTRLDPHATLSSAARLPKARRSPTRGRMGR
jgi:hypothetical protein